MSIARATISSVQGQIASSAYRSNGMRGKLRAIHMSAARPRRKDDNPGLESGVGSRWQAGDFLDVGSKLGIPLLSQATASPSMMQGASATWPRIRRSKGSGYVRSLPGRL